MSQRRTLVCKKIQAKPKDQNETDGPHERDDDGLGSIDSSGLAREGMREKIELAGGRRRKGHEPVDGTGPPVVWRDGKSGASKGRSQRGEEGTRQQDGQQREGQCEGW